MRNMEGSFGSLPRIFSYVFLSFCLAGGVKLKNRRINKHFASGELHSISPRYMFGFLAPEANGSFVEWKCCLLH